MADATSKVDRILPFSPEPRCRTVRTSEAYDLGLFRDIYEHVPRPQVTNFPCVRRDISYPVEFLEEMKRSWAMVYVAYHMLTYPDIDCNSIALLQGPEEVTQSRDRVANSVISISSIFPLFHWALHRLSIPWLLWLASHLQRSPLPRYGRCPCNCCGIMFFERLQATLSAHRGSWERRDLGINAFTIAIEGSEWRYYNCVHIITL